MRWHIAAGTTAALTLVVALAAGCGGGSGGAGTNESLAFYPKGPTRQFIVPGDDNTVQEFGREATPAERSQVSGMVEAWLRDRAQGKWGKACRYMHEKTIAYALRVGTEIDQKPVTSCAKALAAIAPGDAARDPGDNIKDGVASLRIGRGHGYAQYHGREGRDWIVSVRKESGGWKISTLIPSERFK